MPSTQSRARRAKHADRRAAIVILLACFAFFEYYTWTGLFRQSYGLPLLICAELGIGGLGVAWELVRRRRNHGTQ